MERQMVFITNMIDLKMDLDYTLILIRDIRQELTDEFTVERLQ